MDGCGGDGGLVNNDDSGGGGGCGGIETDWNGGDTDLSDSVNNVGGVDNSGGEADFIAVLVMKWW